MRAAALRRNLHQRLGQLPTWIGILGYGTFFGLVPFLFFPQATFGIAHVVAAYALSVCYGLFSPLPWLWTGDDRIWAGHGRGTLQAFAFSMVLLGVSFVPVTLVQGGYSIRPLGPFVPLHPVGLMLVGYFIALGIRQETQHEASATEMKLARFQLLQGQLSPHFLFNALTAFAELGRRDWSSTEKGLLDLAKVYRGLLELGERAEATLGEERALLEAMLSVEALRFGPRLHVVWDWDPGLDGTLLPPLLLLPLVENALKHGLGPSETGGELRITARREGQGIHLEVANTGAWGAAVAGTGTGLKNLQARLRLAFGPGAGFRLTREGDWTLARIGVPESG